MKLSRLLPFLLLAVSLSAPRAAAAPAVAIKVDQAGYLPGMSKVAMIVTEAPAGEFVVRRVGDDRAVFRGKLTAPVYDADTGERVRAADFSELNERGKFYLEIPAVGRSWEFAVAPDVYARAFRLAMRSYYGQRCGTAIDLGAEFPGYEHAACHTAGAYHPSSGKTGARPSVKGWHDAGDYGRYVVNSGIATGTLLWTWELFGERIANTSLDIPESGDRVPDMLDEIRWNLDWMLSMQDRDGGVWHKQTSERFPGFVMPHDDRGASYVIGTGKEPFKSSCATADFAAVMGIAARVYKPYDPAFARRSLDAARAAWAWLDRHPNVAFRNPAGIVTGEYGDRDCGDERLWAAAELWRTTGNEMFRRYFVESFEPYRGTIRPAGPPSWANVAPLALWAYALGGGKDATADLIRRDSLLAADRVALLAARHPYRTAMTASDYVWGSNAVAANYGVQLLVANEFRPDRRYVAAALDNLHYLLGRNTFSLSFVTRVGANPVRRPHHRPSGADANPEPYPGLLAGGPNRSRQDPAMKRLPVLPPARMYLDEEESYAANEVAINWNAPLVFLLAGVLPEE